MHPKHLLSATLLLITLQTQATPEISQADLHWLNRVTFGANSQSIEAFVTLGKAGYLKQQLEAGQNEQRAESSLPETLWRRAAARKAANQLAQGEEKAAALSTLQTERTQLLKAAQEQQLREAITSPHQLQAKMAWFWFNHFTVYAYKGDIAVMLDDYEATLRPYLLGNFRDLLRASIRHPAMMVYLDNHQSRAGKINENYARELMELHTMGVDGGYTQQDVQELSRILTGLQVNYDGKPPKMPEAHQAEHQLDGAFQFNPAHHDYGDKTWLGHTIKGKGWDEIEEVIDVLVNHPATARHIARRLTRYFVADEPPIRLVAMSASAFMRSNGNIAEVLRVIFESPEFEASLSKKLKSPYQYAVSSIRALDIDLDNEIPPALYRLPQRLNETMYLRITPDGYPLATAEWANTGQLMARLNEAATLSRIWYKQAQTTPNYTRPWLMQGPILGSNSTEVIERQSEPVARTRLFLSSPEFMYH